VLQLNASSVEEKRKMDSTRAPILSAKDFEDPFHQGRLSRTGFSLDPEKTVIICKPFLIILVLKDPCT
jgi:hypothetical protein